jgi:hypothetical protein
MRLSFKSGGAPLTGRDVARYQWYMSFAPRLATLAIALWNAMIAVGSVEKAALSAVSRAGEPSTVPRRDIRRPFWSGELEVLVMSLVRAR